MKQTQKPGVQFFSGIPVNVPNSTYQGDGFHISHNDRDVRIYGDVTTALVLRGGEAFYILNGDHRAGYAAVIDQGFDACLAYFGQNIAQISKYSDKLPSGDVAPAPASA